MGRDGSAFYDDFVDSEPIFGNTKSKVDSLDVVILGRLFWRANLD